MVIKDEHLQQWVIHFNPYTREWNGFLRIHYTDYFNGMGGNNILRASSVGKLLLMIKEKHNELH